MKLTPKSNYFIFRDMKHKVGDKVRIKSKEWFDKNRQLLRGKTYGVAPDRENGQRCSFIDPMRKYCGREATIASIVSEKYYTIDIDPAHLWCWVDWMFED